MKWTEGHIHVAMRQILVDKGWQLIAGEFPGGSDHELYPLNVVDPAVARDYSPDPRRHSLGELIPDLVALRGRELFIGEAKVRYNEPDRIKLRTLISDRRMDLLASLRTFAVDRRIRELTDIESLILRPTLVFLAGSKAPPTCNYISYLRIESTTNGYFEGPLIGDSI